MDNWVKVAATGLAVIGVGALARKVWQAKRLETQLETVIDGNIHKADLKEVTLRIDVMLKNPTGGSISFKHPTLKIKHGANTLATSEIRGRDYRILKYGQQALDPIYIKIPLSALVIEAPALLAEYRKSGAMKLSVEVISTLEGTIPYSRIIEKTFTL